MDEECLSAWSYGANLGEGFTAEEKVNFGEKVLQALLFQWQLARCYELVRDIRAHLKYDIMFLCWT